MESTFILRSETIKANCLNTIRGFNDVWVVEIKPYKSKRSRDQNSMYWAWMNIIGREIGQHKDDMHRTFSIRLLEPELFVVDGRQYVGAKSTTKLSVAEFSEYLQKIEAVAMEMGIRLPTPDYFGLEK